MADWLAANLAQRAARDALDETQRREAEQTNCPACGKPECGSALCEAKRRKAEQQAKLAVLAARHLGVGL